MRFSCARELVLSAARREKSSKGKNNKPATLVAVAGFLISGRAFRSASRPMRAWIWSFAGANSFEGQRVSAPSPIRTIPAGVLSSRSRGIPPIQDHLDVLSILQNLEKLIVQPSPAPAHDQHRFPVFREAFGTGCTDRPRDLWIAQRLFLTKTRPAPRTDSPQGSLLLISPPGDPWRLLRLRAYTRRGTHFFRHKGWFYSRASRMRAFSK